MLFEFTKENMNFFLKELGKEFRKLNGTKIQAEIILIGGGSILANYNFREMTTDMDAVIHASSVMKEAILRVSDKHNLPYDWLNTDFKRTASFSKRLEEVSVYYKTFSNILEIRTITAEYLIAMKLMSGRQYKNDLSDIAGILWEHKKSGNLITRKKINDAIIKLYENNQIPDISMNLLDEVFSNENFENSYKKFRKSEIEINNTVREFRQKYPDEAKKQSINDIIEIIRQRKGESE